MQMTVVCQRWDIPYLNISDVINPVEIASKLEETDPKIILCSIEDISNPAIQAQLQSLEVSYIALDECQVITPGSNPGQLRASALIVYVKLVRPDCEDQV